MRKQRDIAIDRKQIILFKYSTILFIVLTFNLFAKTHYIAGNGSDSNDGSLEHPWASVEYGISQLMNNDTLYIRGGIYYEKSMSIANLSNIYISSFPDERVEISGGIPDFIQVQYAKWELFDAGINLYKSASTVPISSYMNAWLLNDDIHLVSYDLLDNLQSTNYGPVQGFTPLYQGPGILLSDDGYLYIRLENNPNDLIDALGNPIPPIPSDIDPNNHSISVFLTETFFYVSNCHNIKFENLTISDARTIMDFESNASDFEFKNCKFNFGRYGFVFRVDAADDFNINNCEFNNGTPDYVYWTDVKNRSSEVNEPYPEFQSSALQGPVSNFIIENNIFRDSFDAMNLKAGTKNTKIYKNEFIRLKDDAITLGIVSNVEIAHNFIWYVRSGISCDYDSDTSTDGDVYIHHNVIDASHLWHGGREGNYRANHWPVWSTGGPFGSHGDLYPAKWKVYNNTTVSRKSGYGYDAADVDEKVQENNDLYVYNNIFLILDDRIAFKLRSASSGAHYDGNVMYRLLESTYHQPNPSKYPLYYKFGNGTNYATLFDFRSNSGTDWEINGLEINPQMDVSKIENGVYEGDATRTRYISLNAQVYTMGALYDGLNWPGTEEINYRGALGDSMFTSIDNDLKTESVPKNFILKQNYPNPFNPSTKIEYSVPKPTRVELTIYNICGQKIRLLLYEEVAAGIHTVEFQMNDLAGGVYFYQLKADDFASVKKMVLLK